MSDLAARVAGLSPVQRKLLEQRLKNQPPAQPAAESIAIIGMSCRFPGAPDLRSFWQLIDEGRSAAREVPSDRWSVDAFFDATGEIPGKMSVRWAALIDNPDLFEPQFFGITPREAVRMDPQQRLLLETAWEAMENAGRPPEELAGTRTGVFIGIGGNDYSKVNIGQDSYYHNIDAHMGTGNALSIAANRISYIFDLHGPSAAIDTACSSSSLAIHFAVESLRRGESDAALAGGANLILTPETTIAFSKARMLSPEGMCRPFDARANGYVRGEGCGLVLLKRLSDAERDGDNILAIIRATSVNQDGRTSGISAPNSQSQMACIREAHKQAGLKPDDIDYIEAHGTGTPLGDPIEMMALGQVFPASDSTKKPCYVTSVKANIGHMETVSGVAGLIKTVLMMQHEEIAPQTHFESLNPHINLTGTRLEIPTQRVPWPRSKRRRIAGVSSFGFGGTNTHMIVEAPGEPAATLEHNGSSIDHPSADRPLHLLKLSAKSEAALKQQAEQLSASLEKEPGRALADICWSANTGWTDFNHRAILTATDTDQLQQRLKSFAPGEAASAAGIKQATVRAIGRPNVAFLFTGQGAQYVGMGRGLYESQPVFRRALEKCDAILSKYWNGDSLLTILYPAAVSSGDDRVNQTRYTQPALFALEYALAELWASWGVKPDIVLGHSVGEYAAACVASVMSLEDGLQLIAERARLMQNVKQHGKMAVVFATRDRVAKEIAAAGGHVVIAVLNGPENIVISGDADAVDALAAKLTADGIQVKMLNVSHAFHSPLMDEMLDEFERIASKIKFHPPRVPLAANLTGQLMTEAPTARYWRDHLRNAVQFAAGMTRIAEAEPAIVIEIGPSASLLGMGRRCEPKLQSAWLPSLREGQEDWSVIAASVAEYYVRGGSINWRGWDQPWHRRRLLLPNYPFQRSRHWFEVDLSRRVPSPGDYFPTGSSDGNRPAHPLLGRPLATVWTHKLFESRLSANSPAYLADHKVQGSVVTPAAAYIEQALAAATEVFGPGRHGIANLTIQQAMFLPEGTHRRVQVAASPESGGESTVEIYSRSDEPGDTATAWNMHATGTLVHESKAAAANAEVEKIDLEAARDRAVMIRSRDEFYESIAERGLAYGPSFRMLGELHRGVEDAVASIELPESIAREASAYHLHPVLGDALLQAMAGAVPLEEDGSFTPYTYMPVGVRAVRVRKQIEDFAQPLFAYARRTSEDSQPSPERVEADIFLVTADGEILVEFEGAQVQRLGRTGAADSTNDTSRWLYEIAWRDEPLNASDSTKPVAASVDELWLIFADATGVAHSLADHLAASGNTCVLVEAAEQYSSPSKPMNGHPSRHLIAKINPLDEGHYRQLLEEALGSKKRKCAGVLHLWSLDIDSRDSSQVALKEATNCGCASALQIIRALSRATLANQPPLWLVTAGAQPIVALPGNEATPLNLAQSPMIGFGRVAALELPDFRPRLVDLDPAQLSESTALLSNELQHPTAEGEIAYRRGRRYVARLVRSAASDATHDKAASTELDVPRGPFQLRITQPGSFDALKFVPVERQPIAPGQVEIEIRATGLNFSDVLKALGLYPGIKDAIVPLGIEASGVVTAVGDGVSRFKVGDEVLGVVPYAFASHARTADYAIVHKPKSIDHDAAATIPITFLTAYYGLVRLAQMQPGERVLIHAGAGGVGLAAIQISQLLGAEVFATAGSEAKRDFLKSLGVKHVYSSRSTAFADEILADTNREGVDIVLNSLPGEAISKSLSILRAYGRFLEIGKTDIYQNRMIGLLPFQDNLSYFAIDLDRMLRQRPDYIRDLFAKVMQHFDAGNYKPLMFTRFEAEGTIESFRYMSQRKNIGKVVVSIAERSAPVADSGAQSEIRNPKSEIAHKDGTYLISGGLGALGLRVAEWLAEQGAGAIALLSRRPSPGNSGDVFGEINGAGAKVAVLQGDVSDAASLRAALAQLPADFPPLRGVVHAAGVLADGILTEMTLDQLNRALAPKVEGAWNLHLATRDMPLDFFVLFSSVASVLGSPGQANYAAGNSFLDALAHARRSEGLPATAINWGPWAGSGMAAEAGRDESVKSRGMALIDPSDGLELLGRLIKSGAPQVAVMNAHWADMLKLLGSRRPALLAEIANEVQESGGDVGASRVDHAFRKQLAAADDATQQTLVQEYIRQELARIMGVEPGTLETEQPLSSFGLDSLLALELKNNLESRLDFTLPMAKLMEGPSIVSLAAETTRLLTASGDNNVGGAESTGNADEWTPLVPLRAAGNQPPLILLPALGGDARYYAELLELLGENQPVYVFRPRGIDQDLPPHITVEEMVEDYVAALRKLQPAGPYHLAGWSTGGTFAFALAEALERAGEEVATLAMMDSPLPSLCDDFDVEDDAHFFCDLINFANRCAGADARIDHTQLASLAPADQFPTALAQARASGMVPAETPEHFIRKLVHVGEANVRVLQSYHPSPISATVQFFTPARREALAELSGRTPPSDIDLGWSREVGQAVELYHVAGDHFTMMNAEGVAEIARQLQTFLTRPVASQRS